MAKNAKVSARWSFAGFSFAKLVYGNKDLIKAWLALLLTFMAAVQGGAASWQTALSVLGWSTATLLVKHAADAIDFWSSEVTLK